jgi:hypothetical protein
MIKIQPTELSLLRKCLFLHAPELLPLIDSEKELEIDSVVGNKMREAVGDELCRAGLRQDFEPNEYGMQLEVLIDAVGRLFMHVSPGQAREDVEQDLRASELFRRGMEGQILVKEDNDGILRMYDSETNTYAVYTRDGKNVVLFHPANPSYWANQPGHIANISNN